MQLQLFKTLWGHDGGIAQAIADAHADGFDGIEGAAPLDGPLLREWHMRLADSGLAYIAEITTAGSYVPERKATPAAHLASLRAKLAAAQTLSPLFVTCIAGCDAWDESTSIDFFGEAMRVAQAAGIRIVFETHRARSFFNPWVTQRVCSALPDLELTADFSHWCVVCERLLDSEDDTLRVLAPRIAHIHARVGFDQGPQVSDPRAAHHVDALLAHERWWQQIWEARCAVGQRCFTMTPEFGPDGYQALDRITGKPLGDLREFNGWMAGRQRQHFASWAMQQEKQAKRSVVGEGR